MTGPFLSARQVDLIEKNARYLHLQLWNDRHALWADRVPTRPIELLNPAVALHAIGYSVQSSDCLGEMSSEGRRSEIAGLIDRDNRRVVISTKFTRTEQYFTAAHELGHAVMQPNGAATHRDLPLSGPTFRRNREEAEADRFASAFLMPSKLVATEFMDRFKTDRFRLDEQTAFALLRLRVLEVMQRLNTRRALSMELACCGSYDGEFFEPLYTSFGVSRITMAIRLEELGLIE